jgi:16S rRNA (uracil1498-N3)-methyltransferase
MALPFFYEINITKAAAAFIVSEETSKHCIQVLRMKAGEQLNLTNGKGLLITATIINPDKKHCTVRIDEIQTQAKTARNISIAVSLIKNASRFEWFLEKVTEIGINEIIPLICHRTERQHFRFDRMNGILIAAMLQSQQTWLPVLHEPIDFEKFIRQSKIDQKFIAHCIENDKKELKAFSIQNNTQILIGPEGDFSVNEITLALQNNFVPVSLGPTRLRTETAGVVASTLLMNL